MANCRFWTECSSCLWLFSSQSFLEISTKTFLWCWWLYAFRDKTANWHTNKMHFSSAPSAKNLIFYCCPLSFWLCFILSQTLSLGRTLCWVATCYLILLLMETSLFLLSRPAPLLLLDPALDPVWRSCRLVRQLLVRPLCSTPQLALCLLWNPHRLQVLPKTGGDVDLELGTLNDLLHRPLTHL